jgi:hypothetical protein
MSGGQRLALIAVAAVIAVVSFLIADPGDEGDSEPTRTAATTSTTSTPRSAPAIRRPARRRRPGTFEVTVKEGEPVGGVRRLPVRKGTRVRLTVRSTDATSDEVHVHGYDLKRDLRARGSVRFVFEAKLEGVFEIELEEAKTPLAKLAVGP